MPPCLPPTPSHRVTTSPRPQHADQEDAAMPPRVSLVRGRDRYETASRALALIEDDIVVPDRPVLLKPNLLTKNCPLGVTHVDATRATLEMLWKKGVREATLATGGSTPVDEIVDHYGYRALADQFNLKTLDLNTDESVPVATFDDRLEIVRLPVSKTAAESWVVSVCPMKTHDTLIVTLGLKNVLVGALSGTHVQKVRIHCGYKAFNLSLASMAQSIGPDLTVIDGTVGMQGNGPVFGHPIESGVALASADRIAADIVGLQVMGFQLSQVGYLWYCAQIRDLGDDDIEVVSETIDSCRVPYEPHELFADQLDWPVRSADWRTILQGANPP